MCRANHRVGPVFLCTYSWRTKRVILSCFKKESCTRITRWFSLLRKLRLFFFSSSLNSPSISTSMYDNISSMISQGPRLPVGISFSKL